MRKNLLILLSAAVLFTGCELSWNTSSKSTQLQKDADSEAALQEMVDADKAFSEASAKSGMKKAFLEYIADDAILLRPGFMPIVEGDAIQFLNAQEDTSFTMTWEPKGADMAASKDMGFTYGVYTVKTKDTVLNGTYLSIWKKQADGKWKFVLDTGNQGTGGNKDKEAAPENEEEK